MLFFELEIMNIIMSYILFFFIYIYINLKDYVQAS